MDKEQIIEKLKELGVVTTNVFPKSSFIRNGEVHIGMFKREFEEDFYFYNTFDKKIYKVPKMETDNLEVDNHKGMKKYLIPLFQCKLVWEDKEYIELPDDEYKSMTLRDYACIQLRHPVSSKEWLNTLIKESNDHIINAMSSL